ncbi:acyl-CoA dehydrogenase [Apiospora arundinis]|uniref:Acyl-CoA dehydrogenase n=1 Tax=Apiospora arundinis TaxID=335852 RepID=A0ABR2I1A6_9PEZI
MGDFLPGVAIAFAGASNVGAPPIIYSGTAALKRLWLPGLFTWDTSFCLAITEATAGSDVSAICTSALRIPDGTVHIVNGMKKRVISPYASGISIHKIHNTGHNASDSLWVELTDVKVPIEN